MEGAQGILKTFSSRRGISSLYWKCIFVQILLGQLGAADESYTIEMEAYISLSFLFIVQQRFATCTPKCKTST